ncbi:MAG TPA: conserved phage C-terminal domain-containing protein [Ureibacillus sp.]|nr:conserved phage C-terminal domain-containing protein [Ureibacillus sp.]
MEGWIKIHRKIVEHEIWNDVTTFRLFMLLLLKAAYQDFNYKGIELKKGEFIRSYSKLAEDLAYKEGRGHKTVSKNTVFKSIKKLIDNGMVTVRETELGTLFTVVNYEEYQQFDEFKSVNGERLTERTVNEVRTNGEQEKEYIRNIRIKDIVDYLNLQAKTNYKPTAKKTQTLIKARANEGFTFEDFKKVIDIKSSQWLSDPKMNKYLRPETLFGPKFESYLNEKVTSNNAPNEPGQTTTHQKFNFDLSRGE